MIYFQRKEINMSGLYIRYDYWLSPTMSKPDIKNVQDLSKFTITKRHPIF